MIYPATRSQALSEEKSWKSAHLEDAFQRINPNLNLLFALFGVDILESRRSRVRTHAGAHAARRAVRFIRPKRFRATG